MRTLAVSCSFVLLLTSGATLLLSGRHGDIRKVDVPARAAGLRVTLASLPFSFEENRGQTDSRVRFLARTSAYTVYLTDTESVISLQGSSGHGKAVADSVVFALVGANPHAQIEETEELPGKTNYFFGRDPSQWQTNVPTFGKVRYKSVYPGIDLVYYGNAGQLEHDFVVNPGADPRQVEVSIRSNNGLLKLENGELIIDGVDGRYSLKRPLGKL
jgi:hypothetical protein